MNKQLLRHLTPMIGLAATVLFVPMAGGQAGHEFTEYQITSDPAHQYQPDVAGNRIVWVDERHGSADIFLLDLVTGEEQRLTFQPAAQRWAPHISGDKIVFLQGDREVHLYDLATETEQVIAAGGIKNSARISGDYIVWSDWGDGNYDVYLFDLATGIEIRLTDHPADQLNSDVSGDRVVWQDLRDGRSSLYVYQISTGIETRVTSAVVSQNYPRISGDRIVWQYGPYLYLSDLSTGTEALITTVSSSASFPALSGDLIVWPDFRDGQSDLFLFDLATGEETQLTNDPALQSWWQIWGNRVVFSDDRSASSNVFLIEIATGSEPSIEAILEEIVGYLADGTIDSEGVAESISSLLLQAASALERGNPTAARNTLSAFIRHVEGQAGKHIEANAAALLSEHARAVIDDLEM